MKRPQCVTGKCFNAVFILRQLGKDSALVKAAMQKAADWALTCRHDDGGFGHYPTWHSDRNAVYFQFGSLIQCGRVPEAKKDLPDAQTLSWGHAMTPENVKEVYPPCPVGTPDF